MLPLLRFWRREIGQVANEGLSLGTGRELCEFSLSYQDSLHDIESKQNQHETDGMRNNHCDRIALDICKFKSERQDDGSFKQSEYLDREIVSRFTLLSSVGVTCDERAFQRSFSVKHWLGFSFSSYLQNTVLVAALTPYRVFGTWYLPHLSFCQWAGVLCFKY
jgi:hypothetical protein